MPRPAIVVVLAALLGLAGCVTPSANPQLVGTHDGKESKSLVFLPDMRVLHVLSVAGHEERDLLGYASTIRRTPDSLSIIAPDTSPFLGTSFRVSADFRTVTVHWRSLRDQKDTPGQTQFHRETHG
jgi:hypothetical protein